jgi:hypothetical protein
VTYQGQDLSNLSRISVREQLGFMRAEPDGITRAPFATRTQHACNKQPCRALRNTAWPPNLVLTCYIVILS